MHAVFMSELYQKCKSTVCDCHFLPQTDLLEGHSTLLDSSNPAAGELAPGHTEGKERRIEARPSRL